MGYSGGGCPVLTDVSGTDSNSTCRPGCLSRARDMISCCCFPIILLVFAVTVVSGEMAAFQKDVLKPKPTKVPEKTKGQSGDTRTSWARYLFRMMLPLAVTAFSWVGGTVLAGSAGLWVTVAWNSCKPVWQPKCSWCWKKPQYTSPWAPPGAHRCVLPTLSMEKSDIEIDGFRACSYFPPELGFPPQSCLQWGCWHCRQLPHVLSSRSAQHHRAKCRTKPHWHPEWHLPLELAALAAPPSALWTTQDPWETVLTYLY